MIIYRITNNITNQIYIGQTKKTLVDRIKGHRYANSKLGRALRQYGDSAFSFDVIEETDNPAELDDLEKFWISFYNTVELGYNVLCGGKPTPNEMRKISKFQTKHTKHSKRYLKKKREQQEAIDAIVNIMLNNNVDYNISTLNKNQQRKIKSAVRQAEKAKRDKLKEEIWALCRGSV